MVHVANMLQMKANYIFLLILSGSINAPFSKKKKKRKEISGNDFMVQALKI